MTEQNPAIFLQAGSHPAEDVRRFMAGITNDAEGVLLSTDLEVTEKSGTPDMSVDVAGGRAFILGDEATYQGTYFVENRGTTNVVISAADATNPRIDIIVAEVDDSAYSGATDAWDLKVVTGTPAGSPSVPTTPDNAIKLAEVAVAALASSIVDANITDTRTRYNPGYAAEYFSASGSFTKANYPWAKTVKVTVIGGGGGSGGAEATGGSERAACAGGGGGGCAIKTIDVADLSASETVTVGAGGTAGSGTAGPNTGGTGGTSSFGSHCSATGGAGGAGGNKNAAGATAVASRGYRGNGSGGDINLVGGHGGNGMCYSATPFPGAWGGAGGGTLGGGQSEAAGGWPTSPVAGEPPGGGASGRRVTTSTAAAGNLAGAAGAAGAVLVEIFG